MHNITVKAQPSAAGKRCQRRAPYLERYRALIQRRGQSLFTAPVDLLFGDNCITFCVHLRGERFSAGAQRPSSQVIKPGLESGARN